MRKVDFIPLTAPEIGADKLDRLLGDIYSRHDSTLYHELSSTVRAVKAHALAGGEAAPGVSPLLLMMGQSLVGRLAKDENDHAVIDRAACAIGSKNTSNGPLKSATIYTWMAGISIYSPATRAVREAEMDLQDAALDALALLVGPARGLEQETMIVPGVPSLTMPSRGFLYGDRDLFRSIALKDMPAGTLRQALDSAHAQAYPDYDPLRSLQ